MNDWRDLAAFLVRQPLLALALTSVFLSTAGSLLRKPLPWLAGLLRACGTLGLVAALLLTVAQVARISQGADIDLPQVGMPAQRVEGRETRVPIARDGHFWVKAQLNGVPVRFLVDTGATLTAISPQIAARAGVEDRPLAPDVLMKTANGTVSAKMVSLSEVRFGNVVARDLDAVVAPGIGDANVLGMNLLTRLSGWRVEENVLILTPHHPQSEGEVR